MTRDRALKKIIRSRATKTGERYTTARRHVLNALQPGTAAGSRNPSGPPQPDIDLQSGARDRAAQNPPPTATPRGAISDAKFRERTGYGLAHWFDVLDRFGGVEQGHTASARHLHDVHKVDGWYAQGITVAYERARGVRAVNQRTDGVYEVSVSKVVSATTGDVIQAFTDPRVRRRWTRGVDAALLKALAAALTNPSSKGIVTRADGLARFRYKWGETTVQLYLSPKPGGKVSVVVANGRLSPSAMVEERRAQWRKALEELAHHFQPAARRRGAAGR